nr:hypothetical protein [Tanacetum cinerariifolium]
MMQAKSFLSGLHKHYARKELPKSDIAKQLKMSLNGVLDSYGSIKISFLLRTPYEIYDENVACFWARTKNQLRNLLQQLLNRHGKFTYNEDETMGENENGCQEDNIVELTKMEKQTKIIRQRKEAKNKGKRMFDDVTESTKVCATKEEKCLENLVKALQHTNSAEDQHIEKVKGLRNQVGWGHVWNRFAASLASLLPPGWWDGL